MSRFDPSWHVGRVARAYRLIRGDIGRQAAVGGWIIGLWDFCRVTSREPDADEIARIRDGSRQIVRELEQMAEQGEAGKAALRAYQAKVEKLSRIVTEARAA